MVRKLYKNFVHFRVGLWAIPIPQTLDAINTCVLKKSVDNGNKYRLFRPCEPGIFFPRLGSEFLVYVFVMVTEKKFICRWCSNWEDIVIKKGKYRRNIGSNEKAASPIHTFALKYPNGRFQYFIKDLHTFWYIPTSVEIWVGNSDVTRLRSYIFYCIFKFRCTVK